MRKFIVRKSQIVEYVNLKKAEKIFYKIVEDLHNTKQLNENVSRKNVKQSIIDNYKRKNLITPKVHEMLVKHQIINENFELL